MKKSRHVICLIVASTFFAACSPGEFTASKKAEESLEKIIAGMEASGEYPILDRTDTLGGIDADNNGIRDDIDRIIASKPYTDRQGKAVQQSSKALRLALTSDLKAGAYLKKIQIDYNRAISCMSDVFRGDKINAPNGGIQLMIEYNTLHINTRERYLKYYEFDNTFDGMAIDVGAIKDYCDE